MCSTSSRLPAGAPVSNSGQHVLLTGHTGYAIQEAFEMGYRGAVEGHRRLA